MERMSRMWVYSLAVVVLWIINPELRRLYDWRFGFSSVEVISILPIIALVPHAWSLTMGGGWARLPRILAIAAWCWTGAFLYGLILGTFNGNTLPALYAFANFVVPATLGLWAAADPTPRHVAVRRLSRTLFGVTTFACVYGIIQFVFLPTWDALWLQNVIAEGATSFGRPEPLQVRVFSVLNAPGPFGNYVAIMLLVVLPQLSLRAPLLLAQVCVWLVAFGLTLDRSGWLMFVFGLAIYALLCSRRTKFIATSVVMVACIGCGTLFVAVLPGGDALTATIGDRLESLSDLSNDRSASDRQTVYAEGLAEFSQAPAGRGLGVVGTSAKLGSSGSTIDFDSGILARLIEVGLPGAFMLCAGWFVLIAGLRSSREESFGARDLAAMAIAVTAALFALQLSGDVAGVLVLLLYVVAFMGLKDDLAIPFPALVKTT